MRWVYWLFVVSVALFVSGIGFLVVSTRTAQNTPPATAVALTGLTALTPVASVKQIMQGIINPAATVVYNAVGSSVSTSGTDEWAPKTPEEWEAVGNSAAVLVESGNLLMIGGRAVDTGDWVKMSRALMDATAVAIKAIDARDAGALFESSEAINIACDNCHQKYQRQ
jgi:hypothetical protein